MKSLAGPCVVAILAVIAPAQSADFAVELNVEAVDIRDDVVGARVECEACSALCGGGGSDDVVVGSGGTAVRNLGVEGKEKQQVTFSFDAAPGKNPDDATHYACYVTNIACKPDRTDITGAPVDLQSPRIVKSVVEAYEAGESSRLCATLLDSGTTLRVSGPIATDDLSEMPSDIPTPKGGDDSDGQFEDIKLD